MPHALRRFILIGIALILAPALRAADPANQTTVRPVLSAYSLGIGPVDVLDTYLSPLRYTGISLSARYERMQAAKLNPENLVMRLRTDARYYRTTNPAGNAAQNAIFGDAAWSLLRRWQPAPNLTLGAGGFARANAGIIYLLRNSNNPASAKASVTVGPEAYAVYQTHIGRLPITLRYSLSAALIGAFFSPQYDELYYEIYLGNHSHLVHAAWPGCYLHLDNMLNADLHLGRTGLRIAYAPDIYSTRVAGLTTTIVAHTFTIGVTTEWIALRPGAKDTKSAKIISALY